MTEQAEQPTHAYSYPEVLTLAQKWNQADWRMVTGQYLAAVMVGLTSKINELEHRIRELEKGPRLG